MVAASGEAVDAPISFPNSPVGWDDGRPLSFSNEHFRQRDRLSQRTGEFSQFQRERFSRGRMARLLSHEFIAWRRWPQRERHRRNVPHTPLPDRSHYLVAGHRQLAPEPDAKLESEPRENKLGPAQHARILVLSICTYVGNLGDLLFFPSTIQRHRRLVRAALKR